jgi:hypothetical protein
VASALFFIAVRADYRFTIGLKHACIVSAKVEKFQSDYCGQKVKINQSINKLALILEQLKQYGQLQ